MMKTKNLIIILMIIMLAIIGTAIINADNVQVELSEENFPDDTFRAYIAESLFVEEGTVLGEEYLNSITHLYLSDTDIESLEGIEYFTNLTYLTCFRTNITELDVSGNTNLTYLSCSNTGLEELDVSKNTSLEYLYVQNTNISELDISNNKSLMNLDISESAITDIDLSKNTALTYLWCTDMTLNSLDVTNNINLERLECENTNLTELDVTQNILLEWLDFSYTSISEIDLSQNLNLESLVCGGTPLTALDVSSNTALTYLWGSYLTLDLLDLRNNTNLNYFALNYSIIKCMYVYDAVSEVTFGRAWAVIDVYYEVPNEIWAPMEAYDEADNGNYQHGVRWNPVDYTIEFVVNEVTISSQLCEEYTDIEIPDDPETYTVDGYNYTFTEWSPEVSTTALGDVTYVAQFDKTEAVVTPDTYTITFLDEDGSILSSTEYGYGEEVVLPADPTIANTAEYTYEFDGWLPEVTTVTGNETYTASYSRSKNYYSITFLDDDGSVLAVTGCGYGEEVSLPAEPTKDSTAEYTYEFDGWSPEVTTVTGEETYTATYSTTKNSYTVTFLDDDGSILASTEYFYGDIVENISVPNKPLSQNYEYMFIEWSPALESVVTGEAEYTAVYTVVEIAEDTVTEPEDEIIPDDTDEDIEDEPVIEDTVVDEPSDPDDVVDEEPEDTEVEEDEPEDTVVEEEEESNASQTIQTGDTNLTFILLLGLFCMCGMAVMSYTLYEESVTR